MIEQGNPCPTCKGTTWDVKLSRRKGNGRYRKLVYVSTCIDCGHETTEEAS